MLCPTVWSEAASDTLRPAAAEQAVTADSDKLNAIGAYSGTLYGEGGVTRGEMAKIIISIMDAHNSELL